MRHLKCFLRNRGNSAQVGLVALILENGLLAQLNAVLLLKFFDKCLQELLFVALLLNHSFDLHSDSFQDSSLVHAVACHLAEQFHVSD